MALIFYSEQIREQHKEVEEMLDQEDEEHEQRLNALEQLIAGKVETKSSGMPRHLSSFCPSHDAALSFFLSFPD